MRLKIEKLVDFEELSVKQQRMSFETFEATCPEQREALDWVKNNLTRWMFFAGPTATGKTHLATSVYKERKKTADITCEYINNFEMLRACAGDFLSEGVILKYKILDLLVVDELEKFWKTKTGNEVNIFFEIINARHANEKQTILITNVGWEKLVEIIGKENADPLNRRFAEMGKIIPCKWRGFKKGA